MRFLVAFVLALVSVGLVNSQQIRFVNVIVGGSSDDFELDSNKIFSNVLYAHHTDYRDVDAGTFTPRVTNGGNTVVVGDPVELTAGNLYTFYAWGQDNLVLSMVQDDRFGNPETGKVRVIHAAEKVGMVDVVRERSTQFDDLVSGQIEAYQSTAANTWVYSLRKSTSNSVNHDFQNVRIEKCHIYNVFVVGDESEDGDDGAMTYWVPYNSKDECGQNFGPRVRFLNLSPGTGLLDGIIDGRVLNLNLAPREYSLYETQTPGTHEVGFMDTAGISVTTQTEWKDNKWYTVVIYGPNSDPKMAIYEDIHENPALPLIRVIHLGPTLGTVDVFVNNALFANDVTFEEVRDYKTGPAGALNIRVTSQFGQVLSTSSVPALTGGTYTIYLVGNVGGTGDNTPGVIGPIDAETLPNVLFSYIRFINVVPGSSVYVGSFDDGQTTRALTYLDATDYFRLAPGTRTITVKTQDGELVDSTSLSVLIGEYRTVYINRKSDPRISISYDEFTDGQKVRAMNWVEGTCYDFRFSSAIFNDVCFGNITDYLPFAPAGVIRSSISSSTTGTEVASDNGVFTVVPVVYSTLALGMTSSDNTTAAMINVGLTIDADTERLVDIAPVTLFGPSVALSAVPRV